MTQTHTPGPWAEEAQFVDAENGTQIYTGLGFGPDGRPLADVEQTANARLIAAAPDMCDDHKENARILGYLVNELQGLIPEGKLAALELCRVRAERSAAKATGEPT
jgi:hypothetical protein